MKQKLSVLGIDMAKHVLHLVGMEAHGTMWVRHRLDRAQGMAFRMPLPPTRMGREAGGGADDWARGLREHGHEVMRMAPPVVTPSRKAHKNELRDAEAIAEAMTRPPLRLVPVQSVAQQALQALQRVRERLMNARTALLNEPRGRLHA